MAEAYWTYCLYCHGMIRGVEVLDEYPDVVVLYAHKTCHERHTHGGAITAASERKDAKEVPADLPGDADTGRTDAEPRATDQEFC